MRRIKAYIGANRHDPKRIPVFVFVVVASFVGLDIDGARNARNLVELSGVAGQIGVFFNLAHIALEGPNVGRIEPDQGWEQAPVCFGQLIAHQIALRS